MTMYPCKRKDGWYLLDENGTVKRGPMLTRASVMATNAPDRVLFSLVDMAIDREEFAELDEHDRTIAALAQLAEDVQNGVADDEAAEIFQAVKDRVIAKVGNYPDDR